MKEPISQCTYIYNISVLFSPLFFYLFFCFYKRTGKITTKSFSNNARIPVPYYVMYATVDSLAPSK